MTDLAKDHARAVGLNFTDTMPAAALLDARAKDILNALGAKPYEVAGLMDATAIPEDIKTFLDEVEALG